MSKITKEQVLENLSEVKKYIEEAENKKEEKVVGIKIETRLGSLLFQSTKTTIKEAVMEAKDSGADLSYADLSDADLSGAYLSGADLGGADLGGADLVGAYLSDADLSGANLRGANLRDANLRGANLRGADISGADLSGAEMQNVKFYGRGGTRPLKRSQLPSFLGALGFVIED